MTFEEHVKKIRSGEYGGHPIRITEKNILQVIMACGAILKEHDMATKKTPKKKNANISKEPIHRASQRHKKAMRHHGHTSGSGGK